MKEYLKMADVFEGMLFISKTSEVHDDCGYAFDAEDDDQAKYAAHAINSHDELVTENERLHGVIDELSERLSISRKQFQQIRLYTKDGKIA